MITMFMPTSPVIDAARRQSRSALPDAPVVPHTPRDPRRPSVVRRSAARVLAAAAVRLDPTQRPAALEC
ncbi:hypothetical protein ACQPXM_33150 [Kribbella sp. CA-253562]|uniref:hypothetical protein n=1 Tax=Kribbella sp. CA-253562 TaxID=3239942 RepID=UPI003D8C99C7